MPSLSVIPRSIGQREMDAENIITRSRELQACSMSASLESRQYIIRTHIETGLSPATPWYQRHLESKIRPECDCCMMANPSGSDLHKVPMQRRFDGEGTTISHPFSPVASYDSCAVLAYRYSSKLDGTRDKMRKCLV